MNVIGNRKIFLGISGVLTMVSIFLLIVYGLRLSIDFNGGSRLEIPRTDEISREKVEDAYNKSNREINSIQETDRSYKISSESLSEEKKDVIVGELGVSELSFEVLGPTIGAETRNKAFMAVAIAIVAITVYIALAFRKSSQAVSSWKLGISAILALAHDVIVTLGFFSLFGVLFGVEIDTLFVTAILTIIGFSVHDTIVVFDRIRENIATNVRNLPFEVIVNNSITETLGRSLNTSMTVLFILIAMVLFGGESIRWFVVAFIIGVVVGTYSSIFIAAPLLLEWHNFDNRGGFKKLKETIKKKMNRK